MDEASIYQSVVQAKDNSTFPCQLQKEQVPFGDFSGLYALQFLTYLFGCSPFGGRFIFEEFRIGVIILFRIRLMI